MSRLQKKCLVAAAGIHFLLVIVLLCSGFVTTKPNPDSLPPVDVIPSKTVDDALQSGVREVQPPPPKPVPPVAPPEPVTPPPPEPVKPEVKPVEPPKPVEPVKPPAPPVPEVATPEIHADPKPPKPPKTHKVEVDLHKVVHLTKPVPDPKEVAAKKAQEEADRQAEREEREAARRAERARQERIHAFESAASSIRDNSASATRVELKGDSSVAYANYASVVKSVYTRRWVLPATTTSDQAVVKVSVTIARNGEVIEAHVVERSGDASVDASVQKTLDRVKDIAPFPDDATDQQRTYIIYFDLKAKRNLLG